ncbi:MAG TPA: hypothetical protein PKM63_19510 [Panacibacter sp.]|nr:hypothetical protein [Panacibacter sp.]HNP46492.1 hypothetical protein [Panacibacter sp.]
MIKLSSSTINRPRGERFIDAPYVLSDIDAIINQLQQEPAWKRNDRNAITIFKTRGTTTVIAALHAGSIINDNATDGIISIQVLKGSVLVKTNVKDDLITVNSGNIFFMHREFSHNIWAVEESFLLMVMEEA